MKLIGVLFAAAALLFLPSCNKKSAEEQAAIDDGLIQDYIIANNLITVKDDSGLYVVIDQQGTGPACTPNSDVRVAYTGYFLDGQIFEIWAYRRSDLLNFSISGAQFARN